MGYLKKKGTAQGTKRDLVWGMIVVVCALVLAYVFSSLTVWASESRFLTYSRFIRVEGHERNLEGVNFAPDQYRFASAYLVEYLFKHVPMEWYDINNAYVADLLTREAAWDEEFKRSFSLFVPPAEREKFIASTQKFIDDTLEDLFPTSALIQNMIKASLAGLNWQGYVKEPEKAALLIGELLPREIKNLLEADSEETKIVNGYLTYRFFFSALFLILVYLLCSSFLDRFEALAGMFLVAALLPLVAQDFIQAETMFSLALFTGTLVAVVREKSYFMLLLLIALGCTARTDHAFFAALVYALFTGPAAFKGRDWRAVAKVALALSIPVAATLLLSEFVYPDSVYYLNLFQYGFNLKNGWSFVFPAVFLSLPAIFSYKIGELEFYRKTWMWLIPFVLLNFAVARTSEVRLFLPVIAYCVPFTIAGLRDFTNSTKSRSNTDPKAG